MSIGRMKLSLGRVRRRFFSEKNKLSPLGSWYLNSLNYQYRRSKLKTSPFGNYYEFGVGWGDTMSKYLKALQAFCRSTSLRIEEFNVFGFDSFEGLPAQMDRRDGLSSWHKGDFAVTEAAVAERIRNVTGDRRPSIRLVKGFFQDTLTRSLGDELGKFPPGIVTIDVDYYSSTRLVLDWLRPILPSGAIFYFDDIWSFHGNPLYGELAAITEFNEQNEGFLTPFPSLGMPGYAYVFSRRSFEYAANNGDAAASSRES